jgi:hypothetical protein
VSSLGRRPVLDFGTKPKLRAPVAKLADGPRHIGVPALVDTHRVAVGQTQELRYAVCVEEIVDVYFATHLLQITVVVGSVRA